MKPETTQKNRWSESRGVALIAVLAILTVLAILSASFILYMNIEQQSSSIGIAKVQSDLLAQSALEHVMGQLSRDTEEEPAWDAYSEPWMTSFMPVSDKPEDAVDVDGIPTGPLNGGDARWIYVQDANNVIIGRYALMIEDESGKINANVAAALPGSGQNQGFGTFEMLLTDGKSRGLPVSEAFAKKILGYRYGRDNAPGQYAVDDNLTESTFAADEIDNNANMVFDENGEGVDEQIEYVPENPRWDDRSFSSVQEVLDECAPENKTTVAAKRFMKKYSTVYSRSRDMFYDSRDNKLRRQVNLNVASKDQIRKLLRRANEDERFEPSSKNMRTLIANLMDYRDENHVLTTVESEYGVEAVCFNEIMAHDGSWIRETDWSGWGFPDATGEDGRYHVLSYNWYYGRFWNATGDQVYKWRFSSARRTGTRGSKALVSIRLDRPRRSPTRLEEFMECDKRWPRNFWIGGTVIVYNASTTSSQGFPVGDSPATSQREIVAAVPPAQVDFVINASSNRNSTVTLWTNWRHSGAMWCEYPQQSETYFFMPPDEKMEKFYYQVYNANHAFIPRYGYGKSVVREMDMDGDPAVYSVQPEMRSDNGNYSLKYKYMNGDSIKPNRIGYIPVTITSSRDCRPSSRGIAGKYINFSDAMYFVRPDIVELINISEQPISLRNWGVVVNTGLKADLLAVIDTASHFSPMMSRRYDDPNPEIEPNGYFYLTNNRDIFDREYCDGNGEYGSSLNEQIPVFELPNENWGILYDVVSVRGDDIRVSGAQWKPDQLLGELVEFVSDRKPTADHDPPNGLIKYVWGNNANTLYMGGSDPLGSGLEAGDQVRIRGLPRQGGFVSFSLKNEYNQVVARTTEYGSVDEREYGYSSEKFDPTHYTWIKLAKPTIGGLERDARSRIMRSSEVVKPYIKNHNFVTVAEVQKVRKASDWENIGLTRGGKSSVQVLKAIGKYFTVAGIRLDPEEKDAHVSGWQQAFGTVEFGRGDGVICKNVNWEPGIWRGQTLRMISGNLKGEKYPIIDNQENSITIDGYSVPGRKQLRVSKGDKFSVGPGYATPFYYTRQDSEPGEWEWKNKGLARDDYGLYIFGLNDSINTTEFLEENYNAAIEVAAFNYKTREWDTLPLPEESSSTVGADDAYYIVRGINRHQCEKSDGFYCGQIHAQHISPDGGIKLRLIPHNLQGQKTSGFAWFDYAYIAPGVIDGKININTAPSRVLSALNGLTAREADNVSRGVDENGQVRLKPYKNVTDILDVQGIGPEEYAKLSNLVTTRSDQFRVQIMAESLSDIDQNGVYDATDQILSHTVMDVVIDRKELNDDDPDTSRFKLLLKQ